MPTVKSMKIILQPQEKRHILKGETLKKWLNALHSNYPFATARIETPGTEMPVTLVQVGIVVEHVEFFEE